MPVCHTFLPVHTAKICGVVVCTKTHHNPTSCIKLTCRQRPTLPHPPRCSTISANRLSYRVRNGTGRFPIAINHRHNIRNNTPTTHKPWGAAPDTAQQTRTTKFFSDNTHASPNTPHKRVVNIGQISTSHLTTTYMASSPGLSTPSSLGNLKRNLISKQASRLDAFSGYPSRT